MERRQDHVTTAIQSPPSGPPRNPIPAPPPPVVPHREPKFRTTGQISRAQTILAYTLLVVGSLAFLVPFYFVVNASLKSDAEVQSGDVISPPQSLSADAFAKNYDDIARPHRTTASWWDVSKDAAGAVVRTISKPIGNYPRALSADKMNFWPALSNTVVVTSLSVLGQIISCSLVGFGFARFRFRGRSILFMVMLSTMMLPAQVTMIPVFILFRSMGMIDTFWPLIIPMWLASPFFVFMFRQFFAQIPEELVEAARIDGAGNWRIYWQLMLPLSGPVIAIVAIYTFLGAWNDFLGPLIYLNSPQQRTLALSLNSFNGQYGISDAHLLMAASVVCMLPCVILFFAAQKYFVESVAMTGLKS